MYYTSTTFTVLYSSSCEIPVGSSVVLTGGNNPASNKVSRYNKDGHMEDLPHLITARRYHGCSSMMVGGNTVSDDNFN